jgi:hypothetical protein
VRKTFRHTLEIDRFRGTLMGNHGASQSINDEHLTRAEWKDDDIATTFGGSRIECAVGWDANRGKLERDRDPSCGGGCRPDPRVAPRPDANHNRAQLPAKRAAGE